jgi:beta-glucosidase-like glycosyl hydrolase
MDTGRLLFPALRWHPQTGFDHEAEAIDTALRIGVGGFCFFGGEAEAVRALIAHLRERSPHPLLIASDLERGAGQQFHGATQLPPLAAIGALDELDTTHRAAALTAREALALGVNWVYAPDADVDLEPENPIIGSRAFGTDPGHVSRHVVAWIEGCHSMGVLCCAKHFPGHGRTTEDSHAGLPQVSATRHELERSDLAPFRAAVSAGVDSVMTAHVAFTALDPSGAPATLSAPIVTRLLRDEWGFDGLIVTDALIMEGVLKGGTGEAGASAAAIAAGCDALLYPVKLAEVAAGVDSEIGRSIPESRVRASLDRIERAAARAATTHPASVGLPADVQWAIELGARACVVIHGHPVCPANVELLTIDDDLGGPYPPPPRTAFARALHDKGVSVQEVAAAGGARPLLLAVYSDIRAWKGRPGLSQNALSAIARALDAKPDATIVLFGHPRLAQALPQANLLAAWGGETVMQRAAAAWLTEQPRV